jgi:hypothetical protein
MAIISALSASAGSQGRVAAFTCHKSDKAGISKSHWPAWIASGPSCYGHHNAFVPSGTVASSRQCSVDMTEHDRFVMLPFIERHRRGVAIYDGVDQFIARHDHLLHERNMWCKPRTALT